MQKSTEDHENSPLIRVVNVWPETAQLSAHLSTLSCVGTLTQLWKAQTKTRSKQCSRCTHPTCLATSKDIKTTSSLEYAQHGDFDGKGEKKKSRRREGKSLDMYTWLGLSGVAEVKTGMWHNQKTPAKLPFQQLLKRKAPAGIQSAGSRHLGHTTDH